MTVRELTLQLPEDIYQRLTENAKVGQQSVGDVAIQSLRMGLPPSLEQVPARFQADLQVLAQMDNEMLSRMMAIELSDEKAELYESLLAQNQQAELNEAKQERLDTLREEADLLMLRRAYAAALLKWRGQRIPQLD